MKKCDGAGCPIKETCMRYREEKIHYSEAINSAPYDHYFNKCKYFIKMDLSELKENDYVAFQHKDSKSVQYGKILRFYKPGSISPYEMVEVQFTKDGLYPKGTKLDIKKNSIIFKTIENDKGRSTTESGSVQQDSPDWTHH